MEASAATRHRHEIFKLVLDLCRKRLTGKGGLKDPLTLSEKPKTEPKTGQ